MDKARTCVNCGTSYVPCRASQKFCSNRCFGEDRAKQNVKYFTCETCGKEFLDNNGQNRYCSYECKNNAPSALIEITCKNCYKPFKVTRYRIEHGTQFCSRSCKSAYAWLNIPCGYCGKDIRIRRGNLASHMRKNVQELIFCNLDCLGLYQRGEGHHNWQGGHRKWRGPNWDTQKDLARERDNYTCQECHVTEKQLGRPLDVHHKIPWRKFKNDWIAANDLNNLISLCPSCHTTIEARDHRRPPRSRTIQQAQV